MRLFEGFAGASGTHGTPDKEPDGLKWTIKRTAKTLRQPPSPEFWAEHVAGKRPLGIIPIREDNSCSWGSIDVDRYDVDIMELVKRADDAKFPFVPCRSKSGGLHLFAFLEKPEPAADLQNVLRDAAASLGMAECEIFPKQQRVLIERSDLGSWMVMPYFGSDMDGKLKWQHGLKKTGADMTLVEFVQFAEKRRTSIAALTQICADRRVVPFPGGKKTKKGGRPSKGDFSDGPPCLQHLTSMGVQSEGRKRTLFMMALYYKRADPDNWKQRLEAANRLFFSPPLPSEEVTGVIRSCEKKEYEYTCKEEPMRSHCDSTLCRMRKFGVGKGGEYPVIGGLSKLDTDPPIWFADVEGARLELSTQDLLNYPRFQAACTEKINKCYKLVKHDIWLSILSEALEKVVVIEAPPDSGRAGVFHELLEEFLTNRSRGERREDLWSGRPWENVDKGRHYFPLKSFQRFLKQEGVRELSRPQVISSLRKLGGEPDKFKFSNGAELRVWSVPSNVVQNLGDMKLEAPKIEDKEGDI